MKKWEYKIIYYIEVEDWEEIREAGKEGWEAITISEETKEKYSGWIFKRELKPRKKK